MKTYAKMAWAVETSRPYIGNPIKWDFSENNNIRILEITAGPENFTKITITRNTFQECREELNGQLLDGFFENDQVKRVIEIGA